MALLTSFSSTGTLIVHARPVVAQSAFQRRLENWTAGRGYTQTWVGIWLVSPFQRPQSDDYEALQRRGVLLRVTRWQATG
jgi:hypothetical protein